MARAQDVKGKMERDRAGEWAVACHHYAGLCGPFLLRVCISVLRALRSQLDLRHIFTKEPSGCCVNGDLGGCKY